MWLAHHGVKGQEWGVRNGPPYPLENGQKDRNYYADYTTKGHLFCDSVLRAGTNFKRVQVGNKFEQYEFYATHNSDDAKYFAENFSKNLINRGSDKNNIYQINLKTNKDLKIPSVTKASNIVADKMLRDPKTRDDMKFVLYNSAKLMAKNKTLKKIYSDAYDSLVKTPVNKMTDNQKRGIYTALNLSLVIHNNDKFSSVHSKMYDAFKREGYGAILDINDTYYSTLRGKHPIIVFDLSGIEHTDSRKYNSATEQFE